MKPKWQKRFWELAKFVSKWSKDPDAKVGAVLVSSTGRPIALGFNGFPVAVEDKARRLNDKETKLEMVVHAEENAVLIAGQGAKDSELYVWGKPICSRCAGLIIQSGVEKVIALNPYKAKTTSKWRPKGIRAIKMLREAGVKTRLLAA